ncbi:MAG: DUF7619 domain-containing protein, partial [Flavobacteriales bacterium]
FRCNTQVGVWIRLQNMGTLIPEDLVIDVYVHPDLTISFTSEVPDSIVGDHYYWSRDSLGWFQQFAIYLGVDVGPVGSSSTLSVVVTSPELAEPAASTIGGLVSCAFDPNDKLVTPQGFGAAGAVDIDTEWLEYTIRFQNTGNDTAFSVVLTDELDPDLDPESMLIVGASHPLTRIVVEAPQRAMFRFDNIQLPDSGADQLGSNGYVKYRIRPRADRPHLTAITNQAAIYFDLNAPVITNTVLNTLVDCALHVATIVESGGNELSASPGTAYQWLLNDVPIFNATGPQYTAESSGSYRVRVTSEFGCVSTSDPFVVLSTATPASAPLVTGIAPNPFTESTVLHTSTPLTAADRIEWLDLTGKVVRALTGTGSRHTVLPRNGLIPGAYLLRVTAATGDRSVHRVIVE